MMISPKKINTTFRPVDTLVSPQKPDFRSTPQDSPPEVGSSDTEDWAVEGRSEISLLGNSSSLFDNNSLLASSPPPIPQLSSRIIMVREREPAAPPSNDTPPATASLPRPLQELRNPAPQFGQTSSLRNPLDKSKQDEFAHLFNKPKTGQMRPEHSQNVKQPSQYSAPRQYNPSSTSSDIFEIPASQFQPRQPSGGVPIGIPHNPPARTLYPAPHPVFSSMGHTDGFAPINKGAHNPLQLPRKTFILDEKVDFDPDADIRAEGQQFGAPDLHAYVDAGQASENIKALLEGAFDDEGEKIPRMRPRKKKPRQDDNKSKSLVNRLQALAVNNEAAKVEDAPEDDEEDDGTVEGLKVKLLPHQVDGVAWMIEKETGNHNKRVRLPKGGILADDMGLGKTVQSIALILSNSRPEKGIEPENKNNRILDSTGHGTLVVAPLALIKQWEAEINSKVAQSHELKVLVHHGPNRTKSAEKLKQYDIVITTYQVLASEHANCGDGPDGLKKGCFAVHWYRTMLDEAHTIKNRNAKMTKACYAIHSHYRWCLTGTPMQNNLDELQSLIRFLRVQPYSEMSSWKESISGPMKNGRGNLAMRRLQIFLKACMKRRTKDVLKKDGALNFGGKAKEGEEKAGFQIVARNVETVVGEFTAEERVFYDRLLDRAQSRMKELMGAEKQDYIGALVLLLRLRQACDHPTLTKSDVKDDKDALTTGSKATPTGLQTPRKTSKDTDANDLADLLGGLSVATKRCDICQAHLTRDNAAAGTIRCLECEADLNKSAEKRKKDKKHKKPSRKCKKEKIHRGRGDVKDTSNNAKGRQHRVIIDSDDEDGGEWLVPEDQRQEEGLGQTGGTDDENAEGGGDTLASIDSNSSDSKDENKSSINSFIAHDTDSDDEGPVIRSKLSKKPHRVSKDRQPTQSENDSESHECEESSSESDPKSDSDTEGSSETEFGTRDLIPSTKIRQLLSILEKETPEHKVIVFSQFTSMLDLIEPFLHREKYNFTRYDGSMRNDLREASLHKLRNEKRTRVLLCSLKCGSLGLNLTVASRVVIMEPFWNPFVEEQAIDRVHRLNQTVDVTVYRLSIHNSVEERILELQEAKRKLANAALEGGKAIGKLSMKDILALFKRETEYDHNTLDADPGIFDITRVLEGRDDDATRQKRKAGSLGFREESSVYGRR